MKRDELQSIDEILQGKVEKVQHRKEWRHFLAECIVTVVSVYVIFQYVIGIAFVSGSSRIKSAPQATAARLLVNLSKTAGSPRWT